MTRIALLATAAALSLAVFSGSANAASFNCYKARSHTEAVICDNPRLSDLDTQMSVAYFTALHRLHGWRRAHLQADQVRWLGRRNSCNASVGCLFHAYNDRLSRFGSY